MRVEIGPRDVEKKEFVSVTRDTGKKDSHGRAGAGPTLKAMLEDMHQRMLARWVWLVGCVSGGGEGCT